MLERIVKDFLTLRLKPGALLLLALSGGPDSMTLLHLLLEARKELDFTLHIAHVDHGWREESAKEAKTLEQVARHFNLPFHLHTLHMEGTNDLENRCRSERLAFFHRLHKEHHYQALLLGHHGGDQAETVFKRIAEGSGLKGLGGLYAERVLGELTVWRPLLSIKKEDLITYLKRKRIHYFEDRTNQDTTYLRSRMRKELFPHLEKVFGKKMEGNFARLGKMHQELAEYFDGKSEGIEKKLVYGPFGSYLELNPSIHPVELKYFLKEKGIFSHDALEVLMRLIEHRRSSRLIHGGQMTFQVTRSHLFIYRDPFPDFFERSELWIEEGVEEESGDWRGFWQGKIKKGEGIELVSISTLPPLQIKKLKKWYASNRVPSFFYDKAPISIKEGVVVGDCLTGRNINNFLIMT